MTPVQARKWDEAARSSRENHLDSLDSEEASDGNGVSRNDLEIISLESKLTNHELLDLAEIPGQVTAAHCNQYV